MCFYRRCAQVCRRGYLFDRQLLDESQDEHRALLLGEGIERLPDLVGRLARQNHSLRARTRIAQELDLRLLLAFFSLRRSGLEELLPESLTPVAGVIARQIDGDPVKPCADVRLGAEALALLKGAQETLLRQRLSRIGVARHREQQPVDTPLIELHYLPEIVLGDAYRQSRCSHIQSCARGGQVGSYVPQLHRRLWRTWVYMLRSLARTRFAADLREFRGLRRSPMPFHHGGTKPRRTAKSFKTQSSTDHRPLVTVFHGSSSFGSGLPGRSSSHCA